jgi:HSP20 family protein
MKKRKKERAFDDTFNEFFKFPFDDDFENIMKEMRELMLKFMEDLEQEQLKGKGNEIKRRVYGINLTIGPSGEIDIKQFGDIPPLTTDKKHKKEHIDVRQPLVEVHKTDKTVNAIAEIPGVEEKDIDIKVENKKLILKARNVITGKEYYREIELPFNAKIKSKTYKNGILEIDMEKE